MSTKVWGIDTRTGNCVNINELQEQDKGYITCTNENCNCKLIFNMGSKKDWYFRHPSGVDCTGGSTESILHKLGKEILSDIGLVDVPESKIVFKNSLYEVERADLVVMPDDIHIEQYLPNTQIKPDIWFYTDESYYCLEVVVHHDISEETKRRYYEFGREHNLYVITYNVSEYAKNLDNFKKSDLVSIFVNSKTISTTISSRIIEYEDKLKKGIFKAFLGDIVCPAKSCRVNTRKCKSCPFYVSSGSGKQICYGKECYKTFKDLERDETVEERLDRYWDLIPAREEQQEIFDDDTKIIHPFGVCERCSKPLVLQRGIDTQGISGLKLIKTDIETSEKFGLFLVCPNCGCNKPIVCSKCGKPMKAWINGNKSYKSFGSVFIGCIERETFGGSCTTDTLTVFTDSTCTKYADEIKAVKTLDNYLKRDVKAINRLKKLRG